MDRRPVVRTYCPAYRWYHRRQVDFEMGATEALYFNWSHYISVVSAAPRVYRGHCKLFRGREEVSTTLHYFRGSASYSK